MWFVYGKEKRLARTNKFRTSLAGTPWYFGRSSQASNRVEVIAVSVEITLTHSAKTTCPCQTEVSAST